jgi:hypothetical protein
MEDGVRLGGVRRRRQERLVVELRRPRQFARQPSRYRRRHRRLPDVFAQEVVHRLAILLADPNGYGELVRPELEHDGSRRYGGLWERFTCEALLVAHGSAGGSPSVGYGRRAGTKRQCRRTCQPGLPSVQIHPAPRPDRCHALGEFSGELAAGDLLACGFSFESTRWMFTLASQRPSTCTASI